MNIELKKAKKSDKSKLFNLIQLYFHEISSTIKFEINKNGLYEYEHLDSYWTCENRFPYFIEDEGKTIGFILVNNHIQSVNPKNNQLSIAEFFILNGYKRMGFGKLAVIKLLNKHKSEWEVIPLPRSDGARLFWKTVIKEYTNDNYKTEVINENKTAFLFRS